jgi:hypothetical protein
LPAWTPAALVAALAAGRAAPAPAAPPAQSGEFRFDRRTDPLPFGGNDHLQSLYLVPPLRDAGIVPARSVYIEGGVEVAAQNARETQSGDAARIKGRYWEGAVSARFGIGGNWEAGAALQGANWSADGDLGLVDAGVAEIPREKLNLTVPSSLLLGARHHLLGFGASGRLAAALDFNIPFPDAEDELAAGGKTDLSVALLASGWMAGSEWHANLGLTRPGGETAFLEGVDPSTIVHGGVAVGYPLSDQAAVVAQLQAATSAFRRMNVLDEAPMSVLAGIRFQLGSADVTTGLGTGLTDAAAGVVWGVRLGFHF